MQWRVLLHSDDCIIEGEDIYGNGVNIAARLESHCEPGGVLLSRAIAELVNKKIDIKVVLMKKPKWVVEKERLRKLEKDERFLLFGIHAVGDALLNPSRKKLRLIVTKNSRDKLASAIDVSGVNPEICEAKDLNSLIDKNSIHQGALLEVKPLDWGSFADVVMQSQSTLPNVVLLDRVTDPHNVGAILRSAEVFGASAVIGTKHHSAPETGALAKAASGALERQPYIRVRNLADTILELKKMGFIVLGLDAEVSNDIASAARLYADRPIALVLGAEGPGLRSRTKEVVDDLVRIKPMSSFGSLNVCLLYTSDAADE